MSAVSDRANAMSNVSRMPNVHALKERIGFLESVIDNFPGGLLLLDKNLNVVLCNEQQKRLLDYPAELFANGNPSLETLFRFNATRGEYGPGDVESLVKWRMDRARERKAHIVERTRPNGVVLEIRGMPLEGGGFVTTYLDVTEQRNQQALIAHLAHHDPLTDLPNRALMLDRLRLALARVRRGEAMALYYLDLDKFKPVNDTYGHAVGDALLVEIAERFRSATRDTDTVARVGGDEFVILQSEVRLVSDVETLACRLLRVLRSPIVIGDCALDIGVSIGIALAPIDGLHEDELLSKADRALYQCKSSGGNNYMLHAANNRAMAAAG